MSKIKVNSIEAATGTTVTLPSGQTLDLSSGTVTLPNSSVNLTTKVTGTLPVANGGTGLTTLGSASQVLRVNSGATALEFGTLSSGAVKQIITVTDNTKYKTSSGTTPTNVATPLNLTITPTSSSSRIMLIMSLGALMVGRDDSSLGYGKIMYSVGGGAFNNVTPIGNGATGVGGNHHFTMSYPYADFDSIPHHFTIIHSPATTSALEYRLYFWGESGSATVKLNRSERNGSSDYATLSTFTAMEIV
jgi:hypothetical protein